MNLQKSLEKLFSLHTFGVKLGLENITGFLSSLGNPQKKIKCFHIAGSNGKGSTSAFLASMLYEFGYDVGLYTSPHFIKFNERIKINGIDIPDEFVASFICKHEKYIDERQLTFFEVTTAMAFQYFADEKVDYAVIETGLGGRLDATNVLNPLAVVLTSISLEHTNILGETIQEITTEKAAIIKKGTEVFCGKLPEEAFNVVKKKIDETGSELFKIEDYTLLKGRKLELYTEEIEFDDWTMPLKGEYQKYNAALAALTLIKSLDVNDQQRICSGIKNVVLNTGFQGRYEFYKKNPTIIFDSAHNEEGLEKFLSEFVLDSKNYGKKILLFGAMKDKAIRGMLKKAALHFDNIMVTSINYERAATVEEIKTMAAELNVTVEIVENPSEFVLSFESEDNNACLVVLGSMYLLGEVKSFLNRKQIA
ncbi:MAG: bifunctional folylpolyglutamate synthase/dihydrofolate synthase [Ignavibacteriaceae bacterium]|nr:bifunctional folylpolyglutamate synthase/dihydrofolate synthase [Ignavibacteriaceae bacterium]